MHEGRACGGDHLPFVEKPVGLSVIHPAAETLNQLGHRVAERKSDYQGKDQSEKHLSPLGAIDAVEIVVHGNRRACNPRDQRVTFACGDTECPGKYGPDDDGEHRRA